MKIAPEWAIFLCELVVQSRQYPATQPRAKVAAEFRPEYGND